MNTANDKQPTVAIIGAGLTGLLAAHGLQKNGFNVIVFEQEESIDARPRDWTILLHWGLPLFEKLIPQHIFKELHSALCNPYLQFDAKMESLPVYSGVTGELLFSSHIPSSRRVSRRCLRALLAQDIQIKWNMTFETFTQAEEGVKVEFSNGEAFDVQYLLGADGMSSRVRLALLNSEQAQSRGSGFMFATGITKFSDAAKTGAIVKAHPVAALMMNTGAVGAVGVMSADNPYDMSSWTTFWVKIWRGAAVNLKGEEAVRYMKENTTPLRDVWQSAIEWTPEGSYVGVNEMKYWTPVPWDNRGGCVTLAGDAAHPMLIYRGQGFQHCITDAANYVDALVKVHSTGRPRAQILDAYDQEMIARGGKAVEQSLSEAEKSLDMEAVKTMLMATKGHGR